MVIPCIGGELDGKMVSNGSTSHVHFLSFEPVKSVAGYSLARFSDGGKCWVHETLLGNMAAVEKQYNLVRQLAVDIRMRLACRDPEP